MKGELAEDLSNLGLIDAGAGRVAAAEAAYREADALMPPWSDPAIVGMPAMVSRAGLEISFCALLMTTGRHAEALRRLDAAIPRVDAVLAAEPARHEFRDAALKLHGSRAQALGSLGRRAESAREWGRVVDLAPEGDRRKYRLLRALELVRSGDHDAATAEADRLSPPRGDPAEAVDSYNLACVLALAASAVGGDASLPPAERSLRADRYAGRALARLERAADAGFFRDPGMAALARRDPDLAAVADRPEFRRLLDGSPDRAPRRSP